MDLPGDEGTFTLIKSETGEQFDTDMQDISKDKHVPVSSFDHASLLIRKIKEEVNVDDSSPQLCGESEIEPDYISAHTTQTAYCGEPQEEGQSHNAFLLVNKCIKSDLSDHNIYDTTMDAQRKMKEAPVVIDSEFRNSTTGQCQISSDIIKSEFSHTHMHVIESTQTSQDEKYEDNNLCPIEIFPTASVNQTDITHTAVNSQTSPEFDLRYGHTSYPKKYMSTPIGKRQHACPECDKHFTQAGNLHGHMFRV